MTERNPSQVEFDVPKGMQVDEEWITFDRRKGNKEQNYAEAIAGNIVHEGNDITSEKSRFNTSSTLRDNLTEEVSSREENKVNENLFALDDKWVTNERNRQKYKR